MISNEFEKNSIGNQSFANKKIIEIMLNLNHFKHKIARPPNEAYLYFPSSKEICEIKNLTNKTVINRRFFEGNIKFTEYELKKFQSFVDVCYEKAKTSSESIKIYDFLFNKDNPTENSNKTNKELGFKKKDILRFLISLEFDNEKTYKSLLEFLDFKIKYFPIKLNENIIYILSSGFIYIHGRDNRYRPNIILTPNIFLVESKKNKNLTYTDWMLSVVYLLDYCIEFLFIPGQIESWNIVCDMKDVALYSVPNELKNLLTVIQQNYKNRLNIMYVVNLGTFTGLIWNVIKSLMGEAIQKKMKMINSKYNYTELYENINRNQLEIKFGGLAENITLTYEEYMKNNNNINTFYDNPKMNQNLKLVSKQNLSNNNCDDDYFFSRYKFCFPPNMPSSQYLTEKDLEIIDEILISEEDYKIKVLNDKDIIRSPFYNYENDKDLNNFFEGNNRNIEPNKQNKKQDISSKQNSHFILYDEEEFFSARDYINSESSSILNKSFFPEILKMRKEREFQNNIKFSSTETCNIDDLNTRSEFISFKKKDNQELNNEINFNYNTVDLKEKNNLNNSLKSEKNYNEKSNKVKILKKKKELNNYKHSKNDKEKKEEDILIDDDENSKKCKISCGKVKMECTIF